MDEKFMRRYESFKNSLLLFQKRGNEICQILLY